MRPLESDEPIMPRPPAAQATAGQPVDEQSGGGVIVVGAGLMGVGLAVVFSLAGSFVVLVETETASRSSALSRLDAALSFLFENGLLAAAEAQSALTRVRVTDTLEGSCTVPPRLILEAISEDLERKQALLAQAERLAPPQTLLATNTSGLSITHLAENLRRPERFCGMHFWNPPHLIPLVEVVSGEKTGETAIEQAVALLEEAGKLPVVVRRDLPGFVGNRLLHALQREAMSLVEAGVASAADVDLVVTHGFGRRLGAVGPLAVCDLAGLDLVRDVDSYLLRDLDSSPEPSPLLMRLVKEGKLGAKTGAGFHEWSAPAIASTIARRDESLLRAVLEDRQAGRERG